MKSIKNLALIFSLCFSFSAAETTVQDSIEASESKLSIEIDPIAFALEGFSFHLLLQKENWRGDLGIFGLTLPQNMLPDDSDEISFKGVGVKVDRFISPSWFIGLQASINQFKSLKKGQSKLDKNFAYESSIRVGYRYDLYKGLYVEPWISLGYQDFISDHNAPDLQNLAVFPTVHIGWQF